LQQYTPYSAEPLLQAINRAHRADLHNPAVKSGAKRTIDRGRVTKKHSAAFARMTVVRR
jgi:hypothetical protein